MMRVAYLGNFQPSFSTENDLRRTMLDMGVEVRFCQEGDLAALAALVGSLDTDPPDVILWTSTGSLRAQIPDVGWRDMQVRARLAGIPTVGIHLDRWWGLKRETDVLTSPFFRCEYVFTADGHHEKYWKAAGVNHIWSPPAIAPHNCVRGRERAEFTSDVAFVGNWMAGQYHEEWGHRMQLVNWLKRHHRSRVEFWPKRGQHAIRGQDLADLYASVKVVVGDSCLVPGVDGQPMTKYASDRVPESLGRGAVLLHPDVEGVTDGTLWRPGEHLATWPLGNWDALGARLDDLLVDRAVRDDLSTEGFFWTKSHHTYRNRLDVIFDLLGLKR